MTDTCAVCRKPIAPGKYILQYARDAKTEALLSAAVWCSPECYAKAHPQLQKPGEFRMEI